MDCEKGFDDDDAKQHPCEGRKCKSCARNDCSDYGLYKNPDVWCSKCNGRFYGPSCLHHHTKKQICKNFKTCPGCQAEYRVVKGKPHPCGFAKCPSCQDFQDVQTHRCFIQPVVDEPTDERKTRKFEDPVGFAKENSTQEKNL